MNAIIKKGATIIFVSHNLRAVTEMCHRCILLDRGRVLKNGPVHEVVAEYLNGGLLARGPRPLHEVSITSAVVRGQNGEALQFESGQRAIFDIEVMAATACEKLSVSIAIVDDNLYRVFDTSTERLNHESFALKEGETKKISFELDLHLAQGTYHVACYIFRYDLEKMYDSLLPAATIYVKYDRDTRGVVNLYPRAIVEETNM
jgi:lipopolysaccharide transport system ATP-binding protein